MPHYRIRRFAALLIVIGGMHYPSPQHAAAQIATDDARGVVEVPISQLDDIQEELRYLRARDAERQAWESSIVNRLPDIKLDLISISHRRGVDETGQPQPAINANEPSVCFDRPCECGCSCYPCQCPLPNAPCIDCPHVSTLNPYFNVSIFGALKLDMLLHGPRPISPGVPFFLTPDSPVGLSQNTVSLHARQSTLGAAFTGPQFGGLQSGGLLAAMFFNDSVIADRYGLLPLQAYGELRNEDWRFAAGLQFDVFSPGIPTVLPFSALAGSGNSGNAFRGQLRLERFLRPATDVQWTLQMALSEPITTTIDPAFRISEDNGWPNVEGRIALGLGPVAGAGLAAKRPFEIGVSGVVGQIRTTPPLPGPNDRVVADVWGLGADFRWSVNDFFGVMGEFYTGQTLGTYNGGILQNVNADTLEGVRSTGGWMEIYLYWTPCLHSHIGYGIDDPNDRDVADTPAALGRIQNSTFYSNLLWDVNQTFRIGFEFAWRETDYKALALPDNEGPGFHTQFQWAF